MQNPSFLWSDGNKDSVRLDLAPGVYSVSINDASGCSVNQEYRLFNFGTFVPISFQVTHLNGLVKFQGSSYPNKEMKWDFGDGTTDYDNIVYHHYTGNGVYNVTYSVKQDCGHSTVSKQVIVTEYERPDSEGFTAKNLTSGFDYNADIMYKACKCAGKSFLKTDLNSDIHRIYVFEPQKDEITLLPIEAGYSHWGVNYEPPVCYKDKLYFSGKNPAGRFVLYKTDGTVQGTSQLVLPDARYANNPNMFFIQRDTLYFKGEFIEDGVIGAGHLFKTDGNTIFPLGQNTYQIPQVFKNKVIYRKTITYENSYLYIADQLDKPATTLFTSSYWTTDNVNGYISPLGEVNGYFLFHANTATYGVELWRTDGTVQGTQLVRDINPGTPSSYIYSYLIKDDVLYFTSNQGILWRSDGTPEGTFALNDPETGLPLKNIGALTSFKSKLYFSTLGTGPFQASVKYLWKTDGTQNGSSRLYNPVTKSPAYVTSADLRVFVTDSLYLYYFNDNYNYDKSEIWRTDGAGKFQKLDRLYCNPIPGLLFSDGFNRVYGSKNSNYTSSPDLFILKDSQIPVVNDLAAYSGASVTAEYKGNLKIDWYLPNRNYCVVPPDHSGNRFTFLNTSNLANAPIRYIGVDAEKGLASLAIPLNVYTIPNLYWEIDAVHRCSSNDLKIMYHSSKPFRTGNQFLVNFYTADYGLISTVVPVITGNTLTVNPPADARIFTVKTTLPSLVSSYYSVPTTLTTYRAQVFGDKNIQMGDSTKITLALFGRGPFTFKFGEQVYKDVWRTPVEIYVKPTESTVYQLDNFTGICGSGVVDSQIALVRVSPPCPPNFVHQNSVLPMYYKTNGVIESSGIISPKADTIYQSNKIELLPGFKADSGSKFTATSGGCN
ncbi:3-coathanger stack domain-containing protein [Runella sp.]|uniref:3-coathanger stack domain-containing protein n=1 Tax=Runella sp. TaxID=1960881 RepID=UPI003D13109C